MELAEINEKLEAQLKNTFDIQLDQLPKEAQDILEELVDFQVTTNLCDIDSNLIQEWYNIKRKESIDLKLKCLPIKIDIDHVKNLIDSEEKQIKMFERVIEEQKSVNNAATVEAELHHIQTAFNTRKDKNISKIAVKSEFDMNQLVEKIQMLKKLSNK